MWNGLGQEISEKCFLTSHNFHMTTPWWTSKFARILYKGKGEEARLDATSSNHLYSVQTKKMPAVFIWSHILRICSHSVCYSDMWAHICLENFMERFLLLGWTCCHNGQCNYVRSSGLFSYELGVLINYSCFFWLVRGAPTKVCFFFFHLEGTVWLVHSQYFWNMGTLPKMEA